MPLLAPLDDHQEVWGSGVTYLRSRDARKAESETAADVYQQVYDADRPEIFFKQVGWRTVGHGQTVRIRADTTWNVPEPELCLVINAAAHIVGYTVGNDMSSRDIEGANPPLPPSGQDLRRLSRRRPRHPPRRGRRHDRSRPSTWRSSATEPSPSLADTSTSQMKRTFPDLAEYLMREMTFPHGALLMTGTGIVPPDEFTLQCGDIARIKIDGMTLENTIA